MNTEKIKIEKSEAWVDAMPIQPPPGNTLHVWLSIVSNDHGRHYLKKKVPQGTNPAILELEIVLAPDPIEINNPQSLSYTEGLSKPTQYSSVEIFHEGKKIGTINKIPIIT